MFSDDVAVVVFVFRYFENLVGVKLQAGRDLLTWNQLQAGINSVNNSVQDEHQRMENKCPHTHQHTLGGGLPPQWKDPVCQETNWFNTDQSKIYTSLTEL